MTWKKNRKIHTQGRQIASQLVIQSLSLFEVDPSALEIDLVESEEHLRDDAGDPDPNEQTPARRIGVRGHARKSAITTPSSFGPSSSAINASMAGHEEELQKEREKGQLLSDQLSSKERQKRRLSDQIRALGGSPAPSSSQSPSPCPMTPMKKASIGVGTSPLARLTPLRLFPCADPSLVPPPDEAQENFVRTPSSALENEHFEFN